MAERKLLCAALAGVKILVLETIREMSRIVVSLTRPIEIFRSCGCLNCLGDVVNQLTLLFKLSDVDSFTHDPGRVWDCGATAEAGPYFGE